LPADIATIYRCRWEVELLFREFKTLYDLDEANTSNPAVVQILLYAAVLTLLVSRELLALVIEYADDGAVFPLERWACDRKVAAQRILKRLSNYLDYSPLPLLGWMAADGRIKLSDHWRRHAISGHLDRRRGSRRRDRT